MVAWGVQLDTSEKGEAKVVKLTIIGRPKGIKQMDGCVAVALAPKGPPALPKGLPKVADTAGPGTIVVFIATKQWEKVLPFLKEHADDEVIVEGYPLFDPKGTTTAVLAQQCVTKYQQRQLREQKGVKSEE